MEKVSGFGKGSGSRVSDKKAFDDNWDRIFAKRGGHGSSKIPVEMKPKAPILFNINDCVTCRLTEFGDTEIRKRGFKPTYIDDGMIKIQMWELMHYLGDAIFNGSEQSISGNIINIAA